MEFGVILKASSVKWHNGSLIPATILDPSQRTDCAPGFLSHGAALVGSAPSTFAQHLFFGAKTSGNRVRFMRGLGTRGVNAECEDYSA